jgi:uncharacterized protein involved in exopolysaccharide biosynthesis/Mrp family chromosome partitioning ATPase
MNDNRHPHDAPAGITPADIYFVLFRHKWKIILLTLAGLAGAIYYYRTNTPDWQSEAKILIRYVADKEKVNPTENDSRIMAQDVGQSVIHSELEILTSYDLALEVATNIGPENILGKGANNDITAADVITHGLRVNVIGDSSIVSVVFVNPNIDLVQKVLTQLITVYLARHALVHSDIGASDDILTAEIGQLRNDIEDDDAELQGEKTRNGIVSVEDSEKFYSAQLARVQDEIFQLQEQEDENNAQANQLKTTEEVRSISTNIDVSPEVSQQFRTANAHLTFLQNRVNAYVTGQGWTEQNKLVIETRQEITDAEQALKDLKKKYPGVAETLSAAPDSATSPAWSSIPRHIDFLQQKLKEIQEQAANLETVKIQIAEAERKKQIAMANYEYYAKNLEQRHIDEAMGPDHVSNIEIVQKPLPAYKDPRKFYKTIYTILFAGLAAGLGWAFLIEFYLDRSVKRPIEIQNKLKIPFFLSIPDLNRNSRRRMTATTRRRLALANGNGNSHPDGMEIIANGNGKSIMEVAPWEVDHRLDPYYDALRDRLVSYFESINLTRKPKLVAVTATDRGAGVSTIACGLAASLSETGDGRVLLVDMNQEHGAAQQFFQGKPGCKLDDALIHDKREGALVQENLYVVSEGNISDRLPRALPKRFASLVPKLKASDYDYIIFDMPPVSPTSITTRLAGFMDNVMLVIESEKTDQQVVQQANALLLQSKANVTAVLNKTRHYIPTRLHQDFLSDI